MKRDNCHRNTTRSTCIGAGNVGRSWAIVFARAGHQVSVFDIHDAALDKARAAIKASLTDLLTYKLIDDADAAFQRITFTSDLSAAVADCDYVQESIIERLEAKREVFASLEQHAPDHAILASSTSAIAPSLVADVLTKPGRFLIAHPLNPPHVIPAVELCPGPDTTDHCMNTATGILKAAGMEPLVLSREIDGFVLNRLQAAVMAEAYHLIGTGVCAPSDIETAMTQGLARRWTLIGPFMTGHLNASGGYQDYFDALGPMFRRLAESLDPQYPWTPESVAAVREKMEALIPQEEVAQGQAWRDKRLMQLTRHLSEVDDFE